MKSSLFLLIIFLLAAGCGKKESSLLALGLLVENPSHKMVVWLNDEPVSVMIPGDGRPVPLRILSQTGENRVWVTVENSSGREDFVGMAIMEGSWMDPGNIQEHLRWQTDKNTDISPVFTFKHGRHVGTDRSQFTPVSISNEEALKLAQSKYTLILDRFERRDFEAIGITREFMNSYMDQVASIPDFYERVFEAQNYGVEINCSPEELGVVVGTSTILAYNQQGGLIIEAGPLEQTEDGTLNVRFVFFAISLGHKDGEWHIVY